MKMGTFIIINPGYPVFFIFLIGLLLFFLKYVYIYKNNVIIFIKTDNISWSLKENGDKKDEESTKVENIWREKIE